MYSKVTAGPNTPEEMFATEPPRQTICDMAHSIRELSSDSLDIIIDIRNVVAICPGDPSSHLTDKAPSSLMDEMDQTIQVLKRLNDELRMMKNAIG